MRESDFRRNARALTLAAVVVMANVPTDSGKLMAKDEMDPSKYISKPAPAGLVTDENGAPVAGARVLLYRYEGLRSTDNGIVEETVSGTDGRFAMRQPVWFKRFPNSQGQADQTLFATQAGHALAWAALNQETTQSTLRLTKPVTQTYEVVDLAGHPVLGATLWLRFAEAQTGKQPVFRESVQLADDIGICHASTDEKGRATLDTLPNTTYSIAASKPGSEDELACTTPREGIPRFTLKPAGVLEGRVTDPQGQPAAGVLVWLYPKFRYHIFFTARTDADGRYRVEKIWSNGAGRKDWGRYEVGIVDPRLATATREVAFSPGQKIAGFDFSAEPGTQIDGHLYDPQTREPVAGASVQIDSASGRQYMTTGTQGEFTCRVTAGTIRPFFSSPPPGTYVTEDERGGPPSNLQTEATGDHCAIDLYLPSHLGKLGSVRGRIQTAQGTPVAHCQISTVIAGGRLMRSNWRGNELQHVVSGEDGRFELPNMPVGLAFTLAAKSEDGKWAGRLEGKLGSESEELSAPLIVAPTSAAEVTIVDLAGKPRPNFAVIVVPEANGKDVFSQRQELKTDGAGVLRIPNITPGTSYSIAQNGSRSGSTVLDTAAGAAQKTLTISDEYKVRLLAADGQAMPIESFGDFLAHTTIQGRKTLWSNGAPNILRHEGSDAVIPCVTLALCKPGDQIDFEIETEGGRMVKASGMIPADGTALIVAKASEPPAEVMTQDATIQHVAADEIAVRVVDPAGKPVAGVPVDFSNAFWQDGNDAVVTDEQGIFRLPEMADRYFSYATIQAKGYAPVFVTGDVPQGKGWKAVLQNTARLRGVIGGKDPGRVALLLEKDREASGKRFARQTFNIQYRTSTDEHGAYDFPMEPGAYRFTATSADGRFARGEVTVAPGGAAALPAELHQGAAVTMQFVDCQSGKPVPGIELAIFAKQGDGVYSNRPGSERTSDPQGMARWENLPPGETEFEATRLFFSGGKEPCPYSRWWLADEPVEWRRIDYATRLPTRGDGAQPLYVDVKDAMAPVRVFMEKGVRISGTVTGPDGKPMEGIQVGIVAHTQMISSLTGDSKFSSRTGKQGEFHEYIPAGNGVRYSLSAYTWAQQPAIAANAVSETFASKPGDELTFKLQMSKGGWISGRVVGPEGKQLARVKVTASPQDNLDSPYGNRIVSVDAQGRFRLGPLRAGHYMVRAGVGEGAPLSQIAGSEPKDAGDLSDGEEKQIGELSVSAEVQAAR